MTKTFLRPIPDHLLDDRLPVPKSFRQAEIRAIEIMNETYPDDRCLSSVDSDGDNWKVTVTRISDSDETVDYIPKV